MASAAAPSARATVARPWEFVGREHPLRGDLDAFWGRAADVLQSASRLPEEEPPPLIRSVLRLYPGSPSRLKWASMSLQWRGAAAFRALTLHYRARKRRLVVFAPEDDPLLPSARGISAEPADVLQYVPRRRLTFRAASIGVGAIGKCVREAEVVPSWRRLNAVWAAASRAGAPVSVARPLRLDASGAFFQAELPGEGLARRIDASNATTLLGLAARVHAEIHRLEVPGVPPLDERRFVDEVREHTRVLAVFRPHAAAVAEEAMHRLLATAPRREREVFCHGDFRCAHVLEHEGTAAVVDFDGCGIGDPAHDAAKLIAFLKRDVPHLRERFAGDGGYPELDAAAGAYLDGYAERAASPLEPVRLTWHLLAHELIFLGRMFRRDAYDHVAFERSLERVRELESVLRARRSVRRRP